MSKRYHYDHSLEDYIEVIPDLRVNPDTGKIDQNNKWVIEEACNQFNVGLHVTEFNLYRTEEKMIILDLIENQERFDYSCKEGMTQDEYDIFVEERRIRSCRLREIGDDISWLDVVWNVRVNEVLL